MESSSTLRKGASTDNSPCNRISAEHGAALVLTLIVLSILLIIVVELSYTTKLHIQVSTNVLNDLQFSAALRGALTYITCVLQDDLLTSKVDSLVEDWAKEKTIELGDVSVTFELSDISSKLNVNKLGAKTEGVRERTIAQFDRLATVLGLEVMELGNVLADFVDEDSEGPYEDRAINRSLITHKEVLLLEEITPEVFHGVSSDEEKRSGIGEFITVWGDGKVNLNTASVQVLEALAEGMDKTVASAIVNYRQPSSEGEKPRAFESIEGVKEIPGMTEEIFSAIREDISVKTTAFRAWIVLKKGNFKRVYSAVFTRSGEAVRCVLVEEEFQ